MYEYERVQNSIATASAPSSDPSSHQIRSCVRLFIRSRTVYHAGYVDISEILAYREEIYFSLLVGTCLVFVFVFNPPADGYLSFSTQQQQHMHVVLIRTRSTWKYPGIL